MRMRGSPSFSILLVLGALETPATAAQAPLAFEENAGQADAAVRYLARDLDRTLLVAPEAAWLVLGAGERGCPPRAVRLSVVDGRGSSVVPDSPLPSRCNLFLGRDPAAWRVGLMHHGRVTIPDVAPGVDLVYHGMREAMEYDIVLAPGAERRGLELEIEGADAAVLGAGGELELWLGDARVTQQRPVAWQADGRPVCTELVLRESVGGRVRFGFELAPHDEGQELVIDPVITTSTYLGGSGDEGTATGGWFEEGIGVAVDPAGNAYVTGVTSSVDFPVTAGALQPSSAGGADAFLAKYDPSGDLVYATYLGGSSSDRGVEVAVDAAGSVHLAGTTYSADFPLQAASQSAKSGPSDAFAAKLDPTGAALVYSTYVGGVQLERGDRGSAVALDAAGNAYVAWGDPVSSAGNCHVTTIDPTGAFTGLMGGRMDEYVGREADVAVDASGCVHLMCTTSGHLGLSTTVTSSCGGPALFLNAGKANPEDVVGTAIAIGSAGEVVIVGRTSARDFPTVNPLRPCTGEPDAFVFREGGNATCLGGGGLDAATDVAIDAAGRVLIVGETRSTDFPVRNSSQSALGGGRDAFFLRLDPALTSIDHATYLGGSLDEAASQLAPAGNDVWMAGWTESPDFPVAAASQPTLRGVRDAFVTRFATACGAVDHVCGQGPGQPNPNGVRLFAASGAATPVDFLAYAAGTWGVNVAAGSLDGSGCDQILTGPGPGPVHGPKVNAFWRDGSPVARVNFYAYGTLRHGVEVASGDVEGDGFDEILTGAGPGGVFGPHVRGFDDDGVHPAAIPGINFFAYATLRYGVHVAGGDVDGDGSGEILTGPGPGSVFGPVVHGFDHDGGPTTAIAKVNFAAFATQQYGVLVAAGDVEEDGFAEILATPGPAPQHPASFAGFDYDGAAIAGVPGYAVTVGTSLFGGRLGSGDLDGDGASDLLAAPGPDPAAAARVSALRYDAAGDILAPLHAGFVAFSTAHGASVAAGSLGW